MSRRLSSVVFLLSAVLAVTSCSSEFEKLLAGYDFEKKYSTALQLYGEEKYSKASQLFESLAFTAQGMPQDDTIQFYWAMSNYKMYDYGTAEKNFSDFVQTFPNSPFAAEAEFRMIDCMYRGTYRYELDQRPTNHALGYITRYILDHPGTEYAKYCYDMQTDLHERLDKKAYEGAKLYYHMEDYLAAHHALKNVLKDDADNQYREDIMYYTAMAAYKYAANSVADKQKERYMTFMDEYYNFVSEFPESKHKSELDGLYKKVNKQIKKEE